MARGGNSVIKVRRKEEERPKKWTPSGGEMMAPQEDGDKGPGPKQGKDERARSLCL